MGWMAYNDLLVQWDFDPDDFVGSASISGVDTRSLTTRHLSDQYEYDASTSGGDDIGFKFTVGLQNNEEVIQPYAFRYVLAGLFNVDRLHQASGSPITIAPNPTVELPAILGGGTYELHAVLPTPSYTNNLQTEQDSGINYWRLIDLGEYKTAHDYNGSGSIESQELWFYIPQPDGTPWTTRVGRAVFMPAVEVALDDDGQSVGLRDVSAKAVTRSGGVSVDERARLRTWRGRILSVPQIEVYGAARVGSQTPSREQVASIGHLIQTTGITGQLFWMPEASPGIAGPNDSPSDMSRSYRAYRSAMVCTFDQPPSLQSVDLQLRDTDDNLERGWFADFSVTEELP